MKSAVRRHDIEFMAESASFHSVPGEEGRRVTVHVSVPHDVWILVL